MNIEIYINAILIAFIFVFFHLKLSLTGKQRQGPWQFEILAIRTMYLLLNEAVIYVVRNGYFDYVVSISITI